MLSTIVGFLIVVVIVAVIVGFLKRFGGTFLDATLMNVVIYILYALVLVYALLLLLSLLGVTPAIPWRAP